MISGVAKPLNKKSAYLQYLLLKFKMKYLEGAYDEVLLLHTLNFRNLEDNLTMIHILQNLSEPNSIKLLDSHLPIPCTHHVSKVDIQPTTKSHLSVDLFAESRQSCLI